MDRARSSTEYPVSHYASTVAFDLHIRRTPLLYGLTFPPGSYRVRWLKFHGDGEILIIRRTALAFRYQRSAGSEAYNHLGLLRTR